MKIILLPALGIVSLLTGCVNEHHYYPEPVVNRPVHSTRKAAPSVREEPAGEFRAVEKPSTYSQ